MATFNHVHHPLVPNNEKPLGIRGVEAIILVSIVGIVLVVSILTTIASLTVIYKLRLFPAMETISFTKDNGIRFNGQIDLNHIHLHKNKIEGVSTIVGNIALEAGGSYLRLNEKGIEIGSPSGFSVFSPESGKQIFPPDLSSLSLDSVPTLVVPGGAKNVHKIRSPVDQDLRIHAKGKLRLKGNEGIKMDSKTITFKASNIYLASINSSITLDAKEGVYLNLRDPSLSAQRASPEAEEENFGGDKSTLVLQHKLCVCGRTGRIFRLQLKEPGQNCEDVRFPESINPCI